MIFWIQCDVGGGFHHHMKLMLRDRSTLVVTSKADSQFCEKHWSQFDVTYQKPVCLTKPPCLDWMYVELFDQILITDAVRFHKRSRVTAKLTELILDFECKQKPVFIRTLQPHVIQGILCYEYSRRREEHRRLAEVPETPYEHADMWF